jgi:hypothetical protein
VLFIRALYFNALYKTTIYFSFFLIKNFYVLYNVKNITAINIVNLESQKLEIEKNCGVKNSGKHSHHLNHRLTMSSMQHPKLTLN